MEVHALSVPGAWIFAPAVHSDERGFFLESYRRDALHKATGRSLGIDQVNTSCSKRGTIRGVHYALVPPGQAKYVQCTSGSVYDVIVDVRLGSPTFGQWCAVELNATDPRGVFISEGLGHGFAALEDDTMLTYLCSKSFDPAREFSVNPLDSDLNIAWPTKEPIISPRDVQAPTLAEAAEASQLPTMQACEEWLHTFK